MKQKKHSVVLSVALLILIFTFLAIGHISAGLYTHTGYAWGVGGFVLFIFDTLKSTFEDLVYMISAGVIVLVALIFAIIWIVRIFKNKHKGTNLLSVLLFLLSIGIGLSVVLSTPVYEVYFDQAISQVAIAYFYILGIVIFVLAVHLLVVGLKESKHRKAELIAPIDADVYVEIDELIVERKAAKQVEPETQPEAKPEPQPQPEAKPEVKVQPEVKPEFKSVPAEKKPQPKGEPKVEPKKEIKTEPMVQPAVKEEVKKVEEVAAAPVVVAEKEKVERIPFPLRMQGVEKDVQADYNLLKNYLLSYGLNSRVSNTADSFRSGRTLYAKLTNSGNSGLKLYLPLKLEDYKDSTIPLKSAKGVKQYEDVPVFIYIRSDLSMKRAHQLIDDLMLKNGIARKYNAADTDHIKELVK